jgi:8-oxo-dGTP pyrophosphatase MutT (NUDIX family)
LILAAGILFRSPQGRVLFCRRTDGEGWAFPAGSKKEHETLEQCAVRETLEETGYRAGHAGKFLCRRVSGDVDFHTYHYECDSEFTPLLNHEHDAFVWVDPNYAVSSLNLHPGCLIALRKLKGMTELELAEAIRDYELTSPQFIENVCLIDMRISGTGFSYRPKLSEWVFRRDTIYLTAEFLQRCNGIPIILDHPETQILNSEEFARRIVGTMALPYIKGDEVWGIARIYDKTVIDMMLSDQLSTSPSVVFRDPGVNYNIELENGETLLVEGNPSFVDHLAICEKGVWDKGGDASGIRVDSEAVGAQQEHTVTAKMDISEYPEPNLPVTGDDEEPADDMQAIPPGILELADGISKLSDRFDKFLARRDLMVR